MKRPGRPASASTKVSVKNQTPISREIVLDPTEVDDPFAAFSEWAALPTSARIAICNALSPRHARP
ncbi:MAG: hypothetical protein ACOY5F_03600 [Pseudomonadota bacterium]